MSLQFILKTPTQDDLTSVYQEIDHYLKAAADHQVFILTDDNMKFDLEMSVLRHMRQVQLDSGATEDEKHAGMMRLQVQSFKRLAWYLLQNQDMQQVQGISDFGNIMLIGRVLADLQDDLLVYRGEYNQIGFIEALADLFKELVNGQITSQVFLDTLKSYDQQDRPLVLNQVKKMKEIGHIYANYEKYLADQTMGDDNIFAQLRQAISEQDLSKTKIIITGFDYFNAQELETIVALLENCPQVQIVLNLDQAYDNKTPDWYELFTVTGKTYHQLVQFARKQSIDLEPNLYAGKNVAYKPGLDILDNYLRTDNRIERGQSNQSQEAKVAVKNDLEIWEVPTVYMESDQIASEIYQLVADPNRELRYKDIQILLRDEDTYQLSLEAALEANEIPFFANFQDDMAIHPLYRMMTAIGNVYRNNWRYQDVFDLLRSELLTPMDINTSFPMDDNSESILYEGLDDLSKRNQDQMRFRDAVDLTENVVLRNGYEGQYWWHKDRIWSYILVDEDGEKIASKRDIAIEVTANQVKSFLVGALEPLFENWQKEQTTQEAVTYFYQFLTANSIPNNLMAWRDAYLEEGRLQEGRQHEQAWQTFINMLDDYVQLFGDETFDIGYFFKILDLAFQNATYAIVPPTMDAVTIASFDEGKVNPKKVTFIMGMSKYALPAVYEEKSLLTDEDRQLIVTQLDDLQALKQSAESKNNNEAYKAYLALLSATEHLYISYPVNNGDSDSEGLSPMIERIANAFDIQIQYIRQPNDDLAEDTVLKLGNGHSQVRYLLSAMAQDKHHQQALSANWLPVYQQIQANESSENLMTWLQTSLNYHNTVLPLTAELAKSLYGESLAVSVSQLELYNRDPFSYYLKYGLRLKERPSFQLDALQTGNYFHDMLDHFFKEVAERDFDLANLSDQEVQTILQEISDQFNNPEIYPEYTVFSVNNRNAYLKSSMDETIHLLVENMIKQRQEVDVTTVETELRFGFDSASSDQETTTHFTLNDGQEVRLRGKIDRVDVANQQTDTGLESFIQVVDYKSSKHEVKFNEIYLGTQLQLYTYLMVALEKIGEKGQQVKPLGAFYQQIFQPNTKITEQSKLTDAYINEKTMAALKLQGYIREDVDLLDEIHQNGFTGGDSSQVYPIKMKKNNEFYKDAKVIKQQELVELLHFVQAKIVSTAQQIISGNIALNPIEDDRYIPSLIEPYRSVSMFDATDYTNKYRPNIKLSKDDFFDRLRDDKLVEDDEEDEFTDEDATN